MKMSAFAVYMLVWCTVSHAMTVENLRCEYMTDPLGLDELAPRLSWNLESDERGAKQNSYRIRVSTTPDGKPDLWDSGTVNSSETTNIVYDGKPLKSRQQCFWTVTVNGVTSEQARWTMGLLEPDDWTAKWISFKDDTPLTATRRKVVLPPARYYRKPFLTLSKVRRATVYATALGVYELTINDEPVTDQMFTPGWSDYRKRVYYNTFDVTDRVKRGENVLGATVADGWYSGYLGFGLLVGYGPNRCGRYFYGKTPALRVQLEIEYTDGSTQTVITDPSWETAEGPIRQADMLMGETYDARIEIADAEWENAILATQNGSIKAPYYDKGGDREVELGFIEPEVVQAYPSVPIRPIETIRPIDITEPDPGVYIFDMGQNFSGIVELKAKGERGTSIQIRHGEMLHQDGKLMTENLRKARATDTYIMKGGEEEIWRPKFTFHGFQFVEVTGLTEKPDKDTVTGIVVHSETPLTSSFECSDPMVNQLFSNIVWTQRSNFLEVPTDCPQRDERLGWTGDAQAYVRSATYNADVAAFFTKWEHDLVESQRENGAYPAYAPFPMQHGSRGKAYGTAWMDAGIICPYTIYKVYGDTRIIERNYESMTRFMDFRREIAPNFQGVFVGNDWGDWLALNKTPIEYIDSIYFAYTSDLMAEMAEAIGRKGDAKKYANWGKRIRAFFNKNYVNDDGSLAVNTQTAYALSLFVNMLPPEKRGLAGQHLANLIEDNDNLMSTGFIGTRPLLPSLTATGHHDLAVRLLQNRRYPSWGFEIVNGATTIWERWNSYTKEDGFVAGMNSFNHYSFGAVCEWMFQSLAGIETDGPGFQKIIICPSPPSQGNGGDADPIDWVRAGYDSVNGRIASHWRVAKDRFQLEVTIPANTTATVYLPAQEGADITESGKALDQAEGVKFITHKDSRAVVRIESGTYRFVVEDFDN